MRPFELTAGFEVAGRKKGRTRCTAKCKQTGEPCKAYAPKGQTVCRMHGAYGGMWHHKDPIKSRERMTDNKLAVLHGAYAKRMLEPEEFEVYAAVKDQIKSQYGLDDGADEITLHFLAFYCAKAYCAMKGGANEAMNQMSSKVSRLLAELKIRHDHRKDQSVQGLPGNVQEFALEVIARFKGKLPATGSPAALPIRTEALDAIEAQFEELADPEPVAVAKPKDGGKS